MNRLKFLVVLFFLATIAVFSQNKKHIPYTVLKGETVESICRKLTITPYTLLQLNPDIKEGLTEGQLIIVPNKEYKPELDTQVEGDYVKDGFLYHKVLPKENYYRLRKQFGVAKRILRKHNLALRTGNLKAGQIIKIPIKAGAKMAAIATPETKDTKPYLVRPKETKYSIATRYGITVEKLESLNPDLKGTVLKMATIINVPNTEAIPDANDDFMTHQVEKGETLFGLSQQFKISQEELITLNPDLEDGVKEGMLIRIPKTTLGANTSIFVPNIPENTHLKIAMMLPFMSNKSISFDSNAEDKKKRKAAKRLNRVTDFYLGAMIALDSIKKQGVSVSVNVFDTENSIATISSILKNNRFDDVDAIVGPMFLNNVKFVSQGLRIDSLAIISPASSKDHSVFASKSMVKEVPSDELLANKVLDYIKRNYTGQHLIVIADDEKENAPRVNRIVATLNTLDSVQKVAVLKPEKGYIKLDLFKEAIQEKKENWFILITKDDVVTSEAINNLGVLPEEINATLFTLGYGSNFERADNNYLARVNFHFPTTNFVDYENKNVQQFIRKYKAVNHAEPTEFAFKGFDIMYDTLLRLASHSKNVDSAFNAGISERTSCKFEYAKKPGKGFENKGIYLVKYDGLNLLKVEDSAAVKAADKDKGAVLKEQGK